MDVVILKTNLLFYPKVGPDVLKSQVQKPLHCSFFKSKLTQMSIIKLFVNFLFVLPQYVQSPKTMFQIEIWRRFKKKNINKYLILLYITLMFIFSNSNNINKAFYWFSCLFYLNMSKVKKSMSQVEIWGSFWRRRRKTIEIYLEH